MSNKYLSSRIIEMAESFGIPTSPGQDEPFTDEAYLGFCDEYRQWALARDGALRQHLQETPTLFRVFLPYNRRVFALVHQVAWYLDEVVDELLEVHSQYSSFLIAMSLLPASRLLG